MLQLDRRCGERHGQIRTLELDEAELGGNALHHRRLALDLLQPRGAVAHVAGRLVVRLRRRVALRPLLDRARVRLRSDRRVQGSGV